MTRLGLAVPVLWAAAAAADPIATKSLAAGVDPCAELVKDPVVAGGTCAAIDHLGKATLYQIAFDDGWKPHHAVRFALVIDGEVAPPLDEMSGAGPCDEAVKTTHKLRRIEVRGSAAIALETTTTYEHACETRANLERWSTHSFVVCRRGSTDTYCLTSRFGTLDARCTATLSDQGALSYRCDEPLAFP